MNISDLRYEIRRRKILETLDYALFFIKDNFFHIFRSAIVIFLSFLILNSFILYFFNDILNGENYKVLLLSLLHISLIVLESPLIELPVTIVLARLLFEQKPRFHDLASDSRKVLIPYIVRNLIVRGLFVTIFAPTIILLWKGLVDWFFTSEIVVLERAGGSDFYKRIKIMSQGIEDKIIGFILIDLLLFIFYVLITLSGFHFITGLLPEKPTGIFSTGMGLHTILSGAIMLSYPVYRSVARFFFYLNCRSMKEAWDIELMFHKTVEGRKA